MAHRANLATRNLPSARPSHSPTQVTLDSVRRTYGRYAPWYDWIFGAVLEPGRRRLTRAVCELQPHRILEVGVGTGLTLARYPASARVTGIDVSQEMLARAQQRAARLPGRKIALHAMDAEQMGFADNSFDCVVLPYVLSVTPHPAQLVAELRRVCRPGGAILILNHFSGSRFWWWLERCVTSIADRVGFRSDFSFEDHVLAYDWEVQSVRPVNLLGLSKLVMLRN
ncbi:class I SAM-dependent methyltransferase [Schlegelella sp. S2-27]|uniref:Class I SAM-dependent methyltransferase n=1 Tax=Caldimonas mangrovi TaxID=2944811 RepID=A0ABT0YJK3_9BURK|nr:class I SAM-dependent methyltransferase [Caldimonas mangrovi]MCM5678838.1 class I SAM-dependent methyltransferase [Caldimonas mangrovi]